MRVLKGLSKAIKCVSHGNKWFSRFSNPVFSECTSRIMPLYPFGTDSLWFVVLTAVSMVCCCVWVRGVPTVGGTYYLHSKCRSTSCVSCLLFFVTVCNVSVILLNPLIGYCTYIKEGLCLPVVGHIRQIEIILNIVYVLPFLFLFRTSDLDSTTSGETWPTIIQVLIYFIKKLSFPLQCRQFRHIMLWL
jgi:hypothetical protein